MFSTGPLWPGLSHLTDDLSRLRVLLPNRGRNLWNKTFNTSTCTGSSGVQPTEFNLIIPSHPTETTGCTHTFRAEHGSAVTQDDFPSESTNGESIFCARFSSSDVSDSLFTRLMARFHGVHLPVWASQSQAVVVWLVRDGCDRRDDTRAPESVNQNKLTCTSDGVIYNEFRGFGT